MQNRITEKGALLNPDGSLRVSGYSTEMLLDYKRSAIKANKFRIKEWDYYYVGNDTHAIALTIADNSYMALISCTLFNFNDKIYETKTVMAPFSLGKLKLPEDTSQGETVFKNKNIDMSFRVEGSKRYLKCNINNFTKGNDLIAQIELIDNHEDCMVIATPYADDKKAFYYNNKTNCMPAMGFVQVGDVMYQFDEDNSFGVLDWGRGVWTYQNTWYWGSLSSKLKDGRRVGFNIGYGFGDTSAASENILFVDGKAHKLNNVTFNIPTKNGKDDFLSTWTFSSDDGRFEFRFEPVLDRCEKINLLFIKTDQHQVFGKFYGKAILDDGEVIELDGNMGFAEKVFNRY